MGCGRSPERLKASARLRSHLAFGRARSIHVSRRGRCDWLGVVPPAAVSHDLIGLGWSPRIRFVLMDQRLVSKHRIDHAPRGFDGIFPDEECRVTTDGIPQQALVGHHFIAGHVPHEQLDALADHRFSGQLDPRAQRDRDVRAEAKANVIRVTCRGGVEDRLRRPLEFHPHFGGRERQALARADVERHARPSGRVDG